MPNTPVFEVHGEFSDEAIDALARLLLSIDEQEALQAKSDQPENQTTLESCK